MKIKFAVITLLLFAFCGPQTQAEICEEYWFVAEYEIELLEENVEDLDNSFTLYNKNELSEGILYANIKEQIVNLDNNIEIISDLTPNEANELYHKRLLTNFEVMKDGLNSLEKWISDSRTFEDRLDAAIEFAEGLTEVLEIKEDWTCPTD